MRTIAIVACDRPVAAVCCAKPGVPTLLHRTTNTRCLVDVADTAPVLAATALADGDRY